MGQTHLFNPRKISKAHVCVQEECGTFSPTLLVEREFHLLKYGDSSSSTKSWCGGRKEDHTRAHSPRRAGAGAGAMGAGARHLREWSAEIWILTLRKRGFLLLFLFLVTWPASVGFLI